MCLLCQARDPSIETYDTHVADSAGTASAPDSVSAALPSFTLDQVANQLTHGYWNATSRNWRAFDAQTGDTLTYDISGLDAAGQAAALDAFEAWEAASGLRFAPVTSGAADLVFMDHNSGAYSYSYIAGNTITQSYINVNTSWQAYGGYYHQTFIHEIGHALGLGHAGNYNGSADWNTDAHYQQDSWSYSIMSYFGQWENPYDSASGNYLATAMMADMVAMAWLYGESTNVNLGNTVYGDNTTLSTVGMNLSTSWAVTLNDDGGTDTIDLGSRYQSQRLDLRAEHFSDINGEVGNLAINRGTVIENAITGNGHDHITGNEGDNHLQSGGGNDTMVGSGGDDTLDGGSGTDLVEMSANFTDYGFTMDGGITMTRAGDSTTLIGIESVSFADGSAVVGSSAEGTTLTFTANGAGYVSEVVTFDTSGSGGWAAVLESYDSDGTATTRTTWYDNGTSVVEDLTGGGTGVTGTGDTGGSSGPVTSTLTDDAGTESWASWTRTWDENGVLQSSLMVMDDGVTRETTYTNGVASLMVATDVNNTQGWASYTDSFDASGTITSSTMIMDNGIERVTSYSAGQRVQVVSTDENDVTGWQTCTDTYDASGNLQTQVMTLDNGIQNLSTFEGGVRRSLTATDVNDAMGWDSYTDTYDASGARTAQSLTWDDGRILDTTFEDGFRTATTMTDGADAFVWSSYSDTFDAAGNRTSHSMMMDNGIEIATSFSGGQRTSTTVTDTADLYAWDSYTDSFNSSGQRTSQSMMRDDGLEIETSFVQNQRTNVTMTDHADSYAWQSVSTSYDYYGRLTGQSMLLDSGRQIDSTFSNGQRTTTTVTDTTDVYAWESYTDHFDLNGDRIRQELIRDDGLEMDTTFVNGQRTSLTVTDGGDSYAWASYTTTYDASGAAVERVLVLDDGREIVTNYMEEPGAVDIA